MCGRLAVASFLVAFLATDTFAQTSPGQGAAPMRPQVQRPLNPGVLPAPSMAARPSVRLPSFPQNFDVQGPEADSYGFPVTQPGTIAVDIQQRGAPVIVTLQSPGAQPIVQQGMGNFRVSANVAPQDVQRSLFWTVQIRLAQPMPPQQGGRAVGSVNVQSPPVDQAAVQRAVQAMPAQQSQPEQASTQVAPQIEQAFQQRKAQFEQLQQQRRATLYAQMQPQVDRLRSLSAAGGAIRSRGGLEVGSKESVANAAVMQRERPALRADTGARLPAFPQKFSVQGPESDSFGFAATQPGPVMVDVQSQGAPVIVTLQNLALPPLTQRGSGPIRLTYQVTPQDVQKSALWVVKIRLAEPAAGQPQAASGTVMVQHPPVDAAIVQAQAAAVAAQERANEERQATAAAAESQAAFQQFKARFEQDQQRVKAAERAQNQALIDQIRGRASGLIRSRGLSTPVIDRLNRNQGQPKDQVILYGRNFGSGGEVIFQLGPNIRGTGVVEAWSDTVVVVDVPDASGLLQFDGSIAIGVGQAQSNALPFRFVPLQEVREIHSTRGDISIAQPGTAHTGPNATYDRVDHDNTTFMQLGGSKGNDIFFPTARLQNGWLVQDIKPKAQGCGTPFCTGVTVADSRIGSDVPYFNVRWWYDALANLKYSFSMWIVGPRGVPDGRSRAGRTAAASAAGDSGPCADESATGYASRSQSRYR